MISRILRILRLQLDIDEMSAPNNQVSLACTDHHNITICTYFRQKSLCLIAVWSRN